MSIKYDSRRDKVFDGLNIALLLGFAAITILPFIYVLAASFATESEIASRPFFLWPDTPTLETYRYIFSTDTFLRSLLVTIGVTAVGTLVQITLTLLMAYPLSDPNLVGRGLIMRLVLFAMLFSGGMIPLFLVVKELGLLDSYWALILPLAINPFNLIVIRTFFQQLPGSCARRRRSTAPTSSRPSGGSCCRCPSPSSRRSPCSTRWRCGTTSCPRCCTSPTARSGRCRCSCDR